MLECIFERGGVSFKKGKRRAQYEVRHDKCMTYVCDGYKGSSETMVYIFKGRIKPTSIDAYVGRGLPLNQATGDGIELLLQAVVPKTVGRALSMLSAERKPKDALLSNVWKIANGK